jgi:hypothetical protein
MPLKVLCRGSSQIRAGTRGVPYAISGTGFGFSPLPTWTHTRHLPICSSRLLQRRGLADIKPSKVNASVVTRPSDLFADLQYRPPRATIAGNADLHESPYTVPNALTIGRIIACPFLGYNIVKGNLEWATGILLVGGFSDMVSSRHSVG